LLKKADIQLDHLQESNMPFIRRDKHGRIIALYAFSQARAEEELHLDHPEVLAFLLPNASSNSAQGLLAESDRQLSRVIEDLIALLVEQNVIRLSDLPAEAQQKLSVRKGLRSKLPGHNQMPEDEDKVI